MRIWLIDHRHPLLSNAIKKCCYGSCLIQHIFSICDLVSHVQYHGPEVRVRHLYLYYKQRSQLSFVESWPLSCECLVTLCHFTIGVFGSVSHINLSTNKGHSWTRSKLDIGDLPWICTPIHVACNHMAVTKNLFYYRYMSQTIGTLHPWLQVYDRPDCG